MSEVGISSIVGYIPKLRLSRKSVAESNSWLAPNLMVREKVQDQCQTGMKIA